MVNLRLSLLLLASTAAVCAQQSPDQPHFEAASIRKTPQATQHLVPGDVPCCVWRHENPARIDYRSIGVPELIARAYQVRSYRIVLPEFLQAPFPERYDLEATLPEGSTVEQIPLMLQAILAESFGMKVRREKRDLLEYVVVVSKDGLKVSKSDAGENPKYKGYTYIQGLYQGTLGWHFVGGMSIGWMTNVLSSGLDHPMIDSTGLEGSYDIDFFWPREVTIGQTSALLSANAVPSPTKPGGADPKVLFAAMEKKLGLTVEPRKGPVEMIIVDHIGRGPKPN